MSAFIDSLASLLLMFRHKIFAFYIGVGLITFTVFSCLASHESVNAATLRYYSIRDNHGHVTPTSWWLANIYAPYFAFLAFLKIALGILLLPLAIFGFHWGQKLLFEGWLDLTVMWSGLLLWTVGLWCVCTVIEYKCRESKSEEDKFGEDK